MNFSENQPGLKARLAHVAIAASSAAAVLTVGVSAVTAMPATAQDLVSEVAQALQLRLPKTPIDEIACDKFGPWCEVVSGETLFYIDKSARYLLVGRLYDMEERRDVTASRLLELNPEPRLAFFASRDKRWRIFEPLSPCPQMVLPQLIQLNLGNRVIVNVTTEHPFSNRTRLVFEISSTRICNRFQLL